jgi:hypothetical protein
MVKPSSSLHQRDNHNLKQFKNFSCGCQCNKNVAPGVGKIGQSFYFIQV